MNANKERDIMWLRVHTIHEIRCSNCGEWIRVMDLMNMMQLINFNERGGEKLITKYIVPIVQKN